MRRVRLAVRAVAAMCVAVVLAVAARPVPAAASHGGAHILVLYSLTCYSLNDPVGDDEPYLKLNNDHIWSDPGCTPIHTYDLGGRQFSFWNEADLWIMEDDFGSDDTVGYIRIGPQAYQGPLYYSSVKWIDGLGYVLNYELRYEIL
jgi:hypothetical protein